MAKKVAIAGCRRSRNFIGPVTRSTMLCATRAMIGSIAVSPPSDRNSEPPADAICHAQRLPSLPPRRSHRFYSRGPNINHTQPRNCSEGLHDKSLFHASSAVHSDPRRLGTVTCDRCGPLEPRTMESTRNQTFCWRWGVQLCCKRSAHQAIRGTVLFDRLFRTHIPCRLVAELGPAGSQPTAVSTPALPRGIANEPCSARQHC